MTPTNPDALSRREREILDILYEQGEASAADVRAAMAEAPSYSAVRGLLRVLLEKEHIKVRKIGAKNVYKPRRNRGTAGKTAMKRALETFYAGDVRDAVAALLDVSKGALKDADRDRLLRMIDEARADDQRESR